MSRLIESTYSTSSFVGFVSSDGQVAVGFRREAGLYGDAAVGGFLDDLFEEIQRLLLRCGFVGFDSHCYLVFFTKLVKNSGCGYLCG